MQVGKLAVAASALLWCSSEPLRAAIQPSSDTSAEERNRKILQDFYPHDSLKLGEEGDVHFLVELNREGKLHSCVVTKSSGYPRLDKATCDMMVATAYFRSAEKDGIRQLSFHPGTVAWRLPPAHERPEGSFVKSASATASAPPSERIVCKRALRTGSLYIKTKLCLTERDWAISEDLARQEVIRLQTSILPRT